MKRLLTRMISWDLRIVQEEVIKLFYLFHPFAYIVAFNRLVSSIISNVIVKENWNILFTRHCNYLHAVGKVLSYSLEK